MHDQLGNIRRGRLNNLLADGIAPDLVEILGQVRRYGGETPETCFSPQGMNSNNHEIGARNMREVVVHDGMLIEAQLYVQYMLDSMLDRMLDSMDEVGILTSLESVRHLRTCKPYR